MRRSLDLSVALSNKKSTMLAGSALPDRIQMATMKREKPVSPASVSPVRQMPGELLDDVPWNRRVLVPMHSIEAALKHGALETRRDD
jgi:hypothetical protein